MNMQHLIKVNNSICEIISQPLGIINHPESKKPERIFFKSKKVVYRDVKGRFQVESFK